MTPVTDNMIASAQECATKGGAAPQGCRTLFFSAEYLLVLSPLLLLSTSALKGLALGVATGLLLIFSSAFNYWILTAVALRPHAIIFRAISLRALVVAAEFIVLAILACCVQLVLMAYQFPLLQSAGWLAPWLVVHTWLTIIVHRATGDLPGFTQVIAVSSLVSVKIVVLLLCMGAVIEVLGAGKLFGYPLWVTHLFVFTPATAWLLLAAFLAASKGIRPEYKPALSPPTASGHKRVRTTGPIK